MTRLALVLPIILLTACGDATTETATTSETGSTATTVATPDYTVPGPYAAGVMTVEFTGSLGQPVKTEIWFPAVEGGSLAASYDAIFPGAAFTDVVPNCDGPRPVMVHSHGHGSVRWEMAHLPEFLASHGWIVAAPDHDGNTFFDQTGDFYEIVDRRPVDIMDAYDYLLSASESGDMGFSGCLDESDGYTASGYSFGGYTAFAVGGALVNDANGGDPRYLSDERVNAIIALAPWDAGGFLTDGTKEVAVPVLTIGGEQDETVGEQYKSLHSYVTTTPRVIASYATVGHMSFVPYACYFLPDSGNGCGDSYIDQDTFIGEMDTTIAAFMGNLQGFDDALDQLPTANTEMTLDVVL